VNEFTVMHSHTGAETCWRTDNVWYVTYT